MKRTSRRLRTAMAVVVVTAMGIPATASVAAAKEPPPSGPVDSTTHIVVAAGKAGKGDEHIGWKSKLDATRDLLRDQTAFGPGGTVDSRPIAIAEPVDTITADYLEVVDILFIGPVKANRWTRDEVHLIERWVNNGGIVVTAQDEEDRDIIGQRFGVPTIDETKNDYNAAAGSHPIVDGPFGTWTKIKTSGDEGRLHVPSGFHVVATDQQGGAAVVEGAVGFGHVYVLGDEGPLKDADRTQERAFTGNLFAHAIGNIPATAPGNLPPEQQPTPEPAPIPPPTPTPEPVPQPGDAATHIVVAAGKQGEDEHIGHKSKLKATRELLLDPSAFGPGGTVDGKAVTIIEPVATITDTYLTDVDVLFVGTAESQEWTTTELDIVERWVGAGGILITTQDDSDHDAVGERFGAPTIDETKNDYTASTSTHPVVSGPFGTWTEIETSGDEGHLGTPAGYTAIATDQLGNTAVAERGVGLGHVFVLGDEGPLKDADRRQERVFTGNLFAHAFAQILDDTAPASTATPAPTTTPTVPPAPTAEPTATPTPAPAEPPAVDSTPAATATAVPTTATDRASLELVSDTMASVVAGDQAWVALVWRALADVEDVRVTITNDAGVGVTYPANTADHSGPYRETGIFVGQTDYTSFLLDVPTDAGAQLQLTAHVTWTAFGEPHSASIPVKLPTVTYTGQDLEILDQTAEPVDGWITVQYRGLAPVLADVQLRVTSGTALPVEYPQGDHTSLGNDNVLEDGETDLARFYVGGGVIPGDVLVLETSYTKEGVPVVVEHQLSIGPTA